MRRTASLLLGFGLLASAVVSPPAASGESIASELDHARHAPDTAVAILRRAERRYQELNLQYLATGSSWRTWPSRC
jgi:hypothetical protein